MRAVLTETNREKGLGRLRLSDGRVLSVDAGMTRSFESTSLVTSGLRTSEVFFAFGVEAPEESAFVSMPWIPIRTTGACPSTRMPQERRSTGRFSIRSTTIGRTRRIRGPSSPGPYRARMDSFRSTLSQAAPTGSSKRSSRSSSAPASGSTAELHPALSHDRREDQAKAFREVRLICTRAHLFVGLPPQ